MEEPKMDYIDTEKQKISSAVEKIKQLLNGDVTNIKIQNEIPVEFLNRKPVYERFRRAGQYIEAEEKLFAVYQDGEIEEIDLAPYSVADIRQGAREDIVEDKDETGLTYGEIIKKHSKPNLEYVANHYKYLKDTGNKQEDQYESTLEIYKANK